jgi:hypothetical protein
MARVPKENHVFRGLLQSEDGLISRITAADHRSIAFETTFGLSEEMIDQLKNQPEHVVFSERSRIARLGIQIKCDPPTADSIKGGRITLSLVASAVIPGYPGLTEMKDLFSIGLPVGRLVFCDPDALLSSDEVLGGDRAGRVETAGIDHHFERWKYRHCAPQGDLPVQGAVR